MTIYLFKDRFGCTDVFLNLYNEMVKRGFHCVKLIDERDSDINGKIDELKGKNVVLITSDHLTSKFGNNYSIQEIVDILSPVKKYFTLHDLGIHCITDDLNGWHVFLPTEQWKELLTPYAEATYSIIGYPKFTSPPDARRKYNTIFFPSSIYVYKDRPSAEFIDTYKWIIDNYIPIKFPDYAGSEIVIEKILSAGADPHIVDMKLSSFDLLLSCQNSITNSNSSIAIEAVIAGCNSINIGVEFEPKSIYKNFPVKNIKSCHEIEQNLSEQPGSHIPEYIFNIDNAIQLITNGNG